MNSQTVNVGISFKANYTISFLNPIDGNEKWVEDRLVKGFTLRERDYKLKIISGPRHLAATHLKFNESLIYYSDISRSSFNSSLTRAIKIENMNRSTVEYPEGTDSAYVIVGYRAEGITVLGEDYFLFKNEVDLVTISYAAAGNLQLVIADSIRNPLAGYKVNLFLAHRKYGSFMNFENVVPYPTKTSDAKGIIDIKHIPRGNYTIQILNPQGIFVQNLTADTNLELNFLVTLIKHFPTVILISSGINAAILLIGIFIYRKSSPP
jgi:hypothetical protein